MNPRRSLLILVGAVVAFVITQVFLSVILGDLMPKLLELETTFSDDRFTGILSGLSDAEITRLQQSLRLDFVYALLYGFVLWWGVRTVNGLTPLNPGTYRLWSAAPVVAASLDFVENLSHLYLIDHRDAITPLAIVLTGSVSWLKWALALGALGFLIWRLPRALLRSRVSP
ncbi:MAG: hypothetical protein M3Q98_07495 [Actinomycetota bacterium]|nr:hypothetical protein [Actinomycetota bacterium]